MSVLQSFLTADLELPWLCRDPSELSLHSLCRESIVSDKWITEEVESSDVGSYMGVPRDLLPEVFFEEDLPPWEELHPRGGCRGLEVKDALYTFKRVLSIVASYRITPVNLCACRQSRGQRSHVTGQLVESNVSGGILFLRTKGTPTGGMLQEELEASSTDLVMYRACINLLASQVQSKAKRKIYLVGPASSGKSIAMAVTVAKMRAAGWLVTS